MTRDDLPEDELMTRLGAVLNTEADRYEPSAGSLARIRERAPAPAGRTFLRWLAPLAAAAVVVAVASGVVLLPGGDHTATPAPGTSTPLPQPTVDPSPTSSEPAPSEEPSPTSSGQPQPNHSSNGSAATCPDKGHHGYVYYASDLNGLGPRLYRATVVVTCTLGIEDMLTVPSGRDDDFTTLWPAGTRVNSVNVSGNVATVDLTAFPATGQVAETAAVQQLVWTVTANDPSLTAVRVRVDGAVPAADINLSNPVRRGELPGHAVPRLDPRAGQRDAAELPRDHPRLRHGLRGTGAPQDLPGRRGGGLVRGGDPHGWVRRGLNDLRPRPREATRSAPTTTTVRTAT